MKVIVIRKWQTDLSTIAELRIKGTDFTGYTLEPAGPDTTTPNQNKRVPEGIYKMRWYNAIKPSLAKYNPLPLIYNDQVAESRLILFHNGNYPKNTDGCLLVGTTRGPNVVNASVTKLKEFKKILQSVSADEITVEIISEYETK